jgi:hypothetical protein
MKRYHCYRCSLPIVMRASYRDKNTKRVVHRVGKKAFPIHVGGRCGQTYWPSILKN